MRVWVNDRMLASPDELALPVTDHGITVGDGVFETVKVVDGEPFAFTRHLRRLATSAAGLALPAPDENAIREAAAQVLAGQDWPLARLRITYTGGPGPMGSGRGSDGPTLIVVADRIDPMPSSTTVVTVPWPRNERGALSGLKTTSYAENVVALARATQAGATEAIFGNLAGNVCEGTGSNIFLVHDGELVTPTLASGCLAGVTRALVLEWYDARELDLPMNVLDEVEEAFLVSTTRDVQAITAIDGRELRGDGRITAEAAAVWKAREAEQIDP